MPKPQADLLPTREGETIEERRLRESINRLGADLMQQLDARIQLRSAPGEVARARHQARGKLEEFALFAQKAHLMSLARTDA